MNLIFYVAGTPVAKGSMRAWITKTGKVNVTASNKPSLAEWSNRISDAARKAAVGQTFSDDEAVYVTAHFAFLRPKSRTKQFEMNTKPDLDKLLRALLDALTGVAFVDDSRVIEIAAFKVYVDGNPGVDVHVETKPIHKRL